MRSCRDCYYCKITLPLLPNRFDRDDFFKRKILYETGGRVNCVRGRWTSPMKTKLGDIYGRHHYPIKMTKYAEECMHYQSMRDPDLVLKWEIKIGTERKEEAS